MTSNQDAPSGFAARMDACTQFVRQRLDQSGAPTAADPAAVQGLMTAVREALYRDYSLWNNEAEYIERLIVRALSERRPDAAV